MTLLGAHHIFHVSGLRVNRGAINHETLVQQSQVLFSITGKGKGKGKAIPVWAWTGPEGSRFQEAKAPRFNDSLHMKVVLLSTLRTGHLNPPGNIPSIYGATAPSEPWPPS